MEKNNLLGKTISWTFKKDYNNKINKKYIGKVIEIIRGNLCIDILGTTDWYLISELMNIKEESDNHNE